MEWPPLVLAATLFGCAPPQKPVPERPAARSTWSQAPVAEKTTSSARPLSTSAPTAAPDEAELEARRTEELAWATAHFPKIAEFEAGESAFARLAALLAWGQPGQALTLFDRACQPALVTRQDDKFSGVLTRDVTRTARTIEESYDEITIGFHLHEFGSNYVAYERDAEGKWAVTTSQGYGNFRRIGHALSRVEGDAAWYDGAAVHLSIDCSRKRREETPCPDGAARVCEQCEAWAVTLHSQEPGFGSHRTVGVVRMMQAASDQCGAPCPVVEPPADVQRANAALRERVFFHDTGDTHPQVFRTKEACRAYRKVQHYDPDDFDGWRAGRPRPPELSSSSEESPHIK